MEKQAFLHAVKLWESDVVIEFSSFQQVTSYIFKLQMDGTPSIEYYTLPGTQNTYSLTNLWMDLSYTFWVKAVNQYGESEYVELHIGGDPDYYIKLSSTGSPMPTSMNLLTSSTEETVTLAFTTRNNMIVDTELESVEIFNIATPAYGKQERHYRSNTPISLRNMPWGVYSVKAIDKKGKVYTSKFFKK
ncbi:MAG: fibronectin type III domain-containing protein [Prevotellaceae bacterium]|nr:fibronectin type III domain-containing protein [Prevotellaceae bacterium]